MTTVNVTPGMSMTKNKCMLKYISLHIATYLPQEVFVLTGNYEK